MTSIQLLTAVATAALLASGAAVAHQSASGADRVQERAAQEACQGEARQERCQNQRPHAHDRHAARVEPALREVANTSLPDQASFGWQYFSDPRAVRAVVISPSGEYFLSRGDGPRQITGPGGQASTTQPARD